MVSEIKSSIVFDYKKYTEENLDRYNQEINKFLNYWSKKNNLMIKFTLEITK